MRPDRIRRREHFIKEFSDIVTGEKIAHSSVWQRENSKQMENPSRPLATHEQACLRVASHFQERWMRHYVASKLRSDPVFAAAFELLRESHAPLLDVGCGVGLLPFYLHERGLQNEVLGFDLAGEKVRRGQEVARVNYPAIDLRECDVMAAPLDSFHGNVALLDLLHYLPPAAQQSLLVRLAACVPPGGLLLVRDAPRDGSARFWMTYAGEIFAQTVRWNVGVRLYFPTLASLHAPFPEQEWTRQEEPAWGHLPFNNRLLIFRRRPSGAAPGAG